MRLALLLKRLLMQVDRGSSFLAAPSMSATHGGPNKRSYSQHATQPVLPPLPRPAPISRPTSPPAKLQRASADSSFAFSSARRGSPSKSNSPSPRGSPKKKHAYQDGQDRLASSSKHKQRNQQHRKPASLSRTSSLKWMRGLPKNPLDGPFHDKEYILKEHFKSGRELKPGYNILPKNPLHNFYAIVKDGQTPTYESVLGTYVRGDERLSVWR